MKLSRWAGLLWELYHDDIVELESQFLQLNRRRETDIRKILIASSNKIQGDRSNELLASVENFLRQQYDRPSTEPQPDDVQCRKITEKLMTRLAGPFNLCSKSVYYSSGKIPQLSRLVRPWPR